jgi:hypothetical protein
MNEADAQKAWLAAVERVKDQTLAPTLWRALEMGHGIDFEDGFFIVGFPPSDAPMAGYLRSSEHKMVIEKSITEILGTPAQVRIIEGTTQADFEHFKKREIAAEQNRVAATQRKQVERAFEASWELVSEQCSRKYANTALRQLPQVRGQFIFESVQIIADSMDRIHPDGKINEYGHRAIARVIEKVATLGDVPGATVAMELVRVMSAKKQRQG